MIPNGSTVSVQSLHQEKDLIFFALWYENTTPSIIHLLLMPDVLRSQARKKSARVPERSIQKRN